MKHNVFVAVFGLCCQASLGLAQSGSPYEPVDPEVLKKWTSAARERNRIGYDDIAEVRRARGMYRRRELERLTAEQIAYLREMFVDFTVID